VYTGDVALLALSSKLAADELETAMKFLGPDKTARTWSLSRLVFLNSMWLLPLSYALRLVWHFSSAALPGWLFPWLREIYFTSFFAVALIYVCYVGSLMRHVISDARWMLRLTRTTAPGQGRSGSGDQRHESIMPHMPNDVRL
jgi:hypothetical protein